MSAPGFLGFDIPCICGKPRPVGTRLCAIIVMHGHYYYAHIAAERNDDLIEFSIGPLPSERAAFDWAETVAIDHGFDLHFHAPEAA